MGNEGSKSQGPQVALPKQRIVKITADGIEGMGEEERKDLVAAPTKAQAFRPPFALLDYSLKKESDKDFRFVVKIGWQTPIPNLRIQDSCLIRFWVLPRMSNRAELGATVHWPEFDKDTSTPFAREFMQLVPVSTYGNNPLMGGTTSSSRTSQCSSKGNRSFGSDTMVQEEFSVPVARMMPGCASNYNLLQLKEWSTNLLYPDTMRLRWPLALELRPREISSHPDIPPIGTTLILFGINDRNQNLSICDRFLVGPNFTVFHVEELFGTEEEDGECIICMSASRETMCAPCKHVCMCRECATQMQLKGVSANLQSRGVDRPSAMRCPLCRQNIESFVSMTGGRLDADATMANLGPAEPLPTLPKQQTPSGIGSRLAAGLADTWEALQHRGTNAADQNQTPEELNPFLRQQREQLIHQRERERAARPVDTGMRPELAGLRTNNTQTPMQVDMGQGNMVEMQSFSRPDAIPRPELGSSSTGIGFPSSSIGSGPRSYSSGNGAMDATAVAASSSATGAASSTGATSSNSAAAAAAAAQAEHEFAAMIASAPVDEAKSSLSVIPPRVMKRLKMEYSKYCTGEGAARLAEDGIVLRPEKQGDLRLFQLLLTTDKIASDTTLGKVLRQSNVDSMKFEIMFTDFFPLQPPKVRCVDPIFNTGSFWIYESGAMCMELLSLSGWSPAISCEQLAVQIRALMMQSSGSICGRGSFDVDEEARKKAWATSEKLDDMHAGEYAKMEG